MATPYQTKVVGPKIPRRTIVTNPRLKIFVKGITYEFAFRGELDSLAVSRARDKIHDSLIASGGDFRSLPPGWRLAKNAG